jgi:hypothetical protein
MNFLDFFCFFNPGDQGCAHISNGTGTKDAFPTGLALPIIVSVFIVLSLLVLCRFRQSCKSCIVNNTTKKEVEESSDELASSQGKLLMDILQVIILDASCDLHFFKD